MAITEHFSSGYVAGSQCCQYNFSKPLWYVYFFKNLWWCSL